MFRASIAHLQEDTVVYKQHMGRIAVLPIAAYQQATRTLIEGVVPYAACIQLCPPEDEQLMLETCRGE
jgi:hypothetical protein